MGKKLLTEQGFFEKLALLILKGRFYKVAAELKKDPELFTASQKFEKAASGLRKALDDYKEKTGVDLDKKDTNN